MATQAYRQRLKAQRAEVRAKREAEQGVASPSRATVRNPKAGNGRGRGWWCRPGPRSPSGLFAMFQNYEHSGMAQGETLTAIAKSYIVSHMTISRLAGVAFMQ
jgi:hypothetical protein